ncbi:MAG TPA: glycosyltransferase family 4 protein [Planctomycetota bacterium]|nr:glycosyltransferase family 4 protein [Planctomycetota bacterium]
MKILLASTYFHPHCVGGAEPYTLELSGELVRRGHGVAVLSTLPGSLRALRLSTEESGGVRIHRFFPANLYSTWSRRRHWLPAKAVWRALSFWNPHAFLAARAVLRRERPDLVHVHNVGSLSFALHSAARGLGIPVLHTVHSTELLCFRTTMIRPSGELCCRPRRLCRAWARASEHFLRRARCVISPSQALLDVYSAHGMFAGVERAVLPFGIRVPERRPRRRGAARNFLCMGTLSPQKGFGDAVRAFRRLELPDARLTVAGQGPLLEQLRAEAAGDARIAFPGFVGGDAKQELIERADVLLVPSICHENSPMVVHEAFARGVPAIGSRIGGIPELVLEGRTGMLFAPGDIDGLAAMMAGLTRADGALERLSAGALGFARERTWDRHMDALLAIYDRHRRK